MEPPGSLIFSDLFNLKTFLAKVTYNLDMRDRDNNGPGSNMEIIYWIRADPDPQHCLKFCRSATVLISIITYLYN
jgi:hypothetical protein